jgi:hypothetical protein
VLDKYNLIDRGLSTSKNKGGGVEVGEVLDACMHHIALKGIESRDGVSIETTDV